MKRRFGCAVINTVDSISGWPKRGVYYFEDQAAATRWMIGRIRKFWPDAKGCEDAECIEAFQNSLDSIEYFHVAECFDGVPCIKENACTTNERQSNKSE